MYLRHYYHVYADGNWRHIVSEHLCSVRSSGLMAELQNLDIGIVGSVTNRCHVVEFLNAALSVPWRLCVEAESGWEQETQDCLYEDALNSNEPFLALYAHTKGSYSPSSLNEVWRKVMTRYTVWEWKQAVSRLNGKVGAAGCFWAPFHNGVDLGLLEGTQYFAGTFWWVRSQAIAAIGRPTRNSRYDAETWIGLIRETHPPFEVACLLDVPLTIRSLSRYIKHFRNDGRA